MNAAKLVNVGSRPSRSDSHLKFPLLGLLATVP